MPLASKGRANERGKSHSEITPLFGSNVCTYVNKFVIKHDEGPHRNTS